DRPSKGRFREHWQLSVEAIGSADSAIDAEVIRLYAEILRRLGLDGWVVEINSIGDAKCRPAYIERLSAWLDEHDAELGEEARQKRATSPLRVFDVKDERTRRVLEGAPTVGESLCDECRAHFAQVLALLDRFGAPYVVVPTLVRGLDYYTRTTFEFRDAEGVVICGGGRYDGLVESIGGPPTPGIGCGGRRPEHAGREMTLAGWAARRRDHGGLVFVDLRDETGVTQLVLNPEHAPQATEVAHGVRNEFVLQARGTVVRRSPETVNPKMATGE